MKMILMCRRTFVSLFATTALTFLGAYKGHDVAYAVAMIVVAVAGANSYERTHTKDPTYKE